MAIAQLQLQVLAFDRGAIANAIDLQVFGEAFGDALNDICRPGAVGAPHRPRPLVRTNRTNDDLVVLDLAFDIVMQGKGKLAELAFRLQDLAVQGHLGAFWNRH